MWKWKKKIVKPIMTDDIDILLEANRKKFPDNDTSFVIINGKKYKWSEFNTIPEEEKIVYYNEIWNYETPINNGLDVNLLLEVKRSEYLIFKISITNASEDKLYFFYSGLIEENLKFRNIINNKVETGFCGLMSHGRKKGEIIKPNKTKIYLLKIFNSYYYKSKEIIHFESKNFIPGKYNAYVGFKVDKNFYCTFSSTKYEDLILLSKKKRIKLWEGNAISNIIEYTIE